MIVKSGGDSTVTRVLSAGAIEAIGGHGLTLGGSALAFYSFFNLITMISYRAEDLRVEGLLIESRRKRVTVLSAAAMVAPASRARDWKRILKV
jgi:hypothetical protein